MKSEGFECVSVGELFQSGGRVVGITEDQRYSDFPEFTLASQDKFKVSTCRLMLMSS